MPQSPTSWLDLRDAVQRAGRIDPDLVDAFAIRRAAAEQAAFDAAGLVYPWEKTLAHERLLTEQVARTALESLEHARFLATVSPAERAARQAEQRAELAESAIPPRPADAAEQRELAAVLRASSYKPLAELFDAIRADIRQIAAE